MLATCHLLRYSIVASKSEIDSKVSKNMRDNLKKKKEIENDDLENFERRQNGL